MVNDQKENQKIGQDKYIKIESGELKYLIEDFSDLTGAFVFGAENPEDVINIKISSDYYQFQEHEGVNYLVFAEGFPIDTYDRIKIIKGEDDVSLPVQFTTVSSITPEALNRNFETLQGITLTIQDIFNNRALRIDDPQGEILLPKLKTGEVWVKSDPGYRAMNVIDIEATVSEAEDRINGAVDSGTKQINLVKEQAINAVINAETTTIKAAEAEALDKISTSKNESVAAVGSMESNVVATVSGKEAEALKSIDTALKEALKEIDNSTDISNKLDKGDYEGTAQTLKDDIDQKLDTEGGAITGSLSVSGTLTTRKITNSILPAENQQMINATATTVYVGNPIVDYVTLEGKTATSYKTNHGVLYHTGNKPTASELGVLSTSGGTVSGNLTVTGVIHSNGNVTAYSDIRLKSNIERIEDPLKKVEAIGGYTFDMYGERKAGVIAQEVQKVLPEVVKEREDGHLSVCYAEIVPLLIEAIKELKKEVNGFRSLVGVV